VSKRTYKRTITVVDRQLQLSLAFKLTAAMAGIGGLYALALYVLPAAGSMDRMSALETRQFFLYTNTIYFALATGILFTLALILTHRIAGAVLVIERAIRATIKGDYSQRLTLRDRDYLKPLAATIRDWRDHLQATESEQRTCIADLERCLQEGDTAAAKELLAKLAATLPGSDAGSRAGEGTEAQAAPASAAS
jgi:hypothetical protein